MLAGDLLDGRFRLVEEVGSGGMGIVFRAIDELAGSMVALKLLNTSHPQAIARARREAEVLARLWHPAIVRYVADGVTAEGNLFLVMEWVGGTTVADRIVGAGLTLRETMAITRQIADALACAHAAGVLHRDIKPTNILLVGGDVAVPKLIDFGIAHVGDSGTSLTLTGAAIGTPGYMSPEQARGDRTLTPACDVFGLGCVLYECATATPAFAGTNVAALMSKILFAQPPNITEICPEAPPALTDLVKAMLAKSTNKRLIDCSEIVFEIDRLGEIPDGPRRSSRKTVRARTRPPADAKSHCLVAAARGFADEVNEPPAPLQLAVLTTAGEKWQARLEVLATGAVLAHLDGDAKDVSHRAALVALAMRRILPGWTITISSVEPDVGAVAESGATLLSATAVAATFGTRPNDGIAIVPSTAKLLSPEFEVKTDPFGCTLLRDTNEK